MIDLETLDSKAVWDRLVMAYGFKTKVALSEFYGLSNSTIANRISRGIFPADFVVRCALETGASLLWLSTGKGPMFEEGSNNNDVVTIERATLSDGRLLTGSFLMFDKSFLPDRLTEPKAVIEGKTTYIVDGKFADIFDGKYLVNIEGKIGVYDLARIPIKKLRVSGGGIKIPFDCGIDDIEVLARVISVTTII